VQRLGNEWLNKQRLGDEDGEATTLHGSGLKTAEMVSSARLSFSFRLVHSCVPNCFDSSLFSNRTNECMLSCSYRWPTRRAKMTMATTAVARATEAWVKVTVPRVNCAAPLCASQQRECLLCHCECPIGNAAFKDHALHRVQPCISCQDTS